MRLSTCVLAVAVVSSSCGSAVDDEPTCWAFPYLDVRATSGSLVFRAAREDVPCRDAACLAACPVEGEADGVEVAVCRPAFREVGSPVASGAFVIEKDLFFPEGGSLRRAVRIASFSPDLTLAFELPDVRSLDGEHDWSSPAHESYFISGSCAPRANIREIPVAGRLRMVSRTGGSDGGDGFTADYHAVVELSGRIEAVGGSSQSGSCLYLPAIEFSFTYEERATERHYYCLSSRSGV